MYNGGSTRCKVAGAGDDAATLEPCRTPLGAQGQCHATVRIATATIPDASTPLAMFSKGSNPARDAAQSQRNGADPPPAPTRVAGERAPRHDSLVMATEATDPTERLLELRGADVRRFAVVRDEASGAERSDVVRPGHAPPTARNEAEAREALRELFGGPIEQTPKQRAALLVELGLGA
jgi:hypothetical protein